MGTPEFAVASLAALHNAGCNIVGVITAPDKPAGRGMKLQQSAVKKYAVEHNLHVLQPEKLKNENFIAELKALNADIQFVVAFRMLPEVVWNMPPMGTINLHGSLLPQYRGAAPINWAIINGEKETGVTTFKLQHQIDTGDVLLSESITIHDDETAGELHDEMKEVGAALLLQTLQQIAEKTIQPKPQAAFTGELKAAPKINTETCKINWNNDVDDVYNLIRGLSPYPTAYTFLHDKLLKIFSCNKEVSTHSFLPGSSHSDNKTFLKFACNDGFINCKEVQLEGKKRILIEDFLRGYRL